MKKILLIGILVLLAVSAAGIRVYGDYIITNPLMPTIEPINFFPYTSECGNHIIEIGEECEPRMQPISPFCPDIAKFCNERCMCQTLCGNGIVEPGEECDGSLSCNPWTCTLGPIRGGPFLFR
jgi:hypothetical protein